MTDAPGEWFSSWAIDEKNDLAQGARWVVDNSDAFLIFADCNRLNGSGRGRARNEIRQLLERIANHVNDRPTTLVWAKSDITPSEKIRESVKTALYKNIPHASEIETTINTPETLKDALESVISSCWLPSRMESIVEPVVKAIPFEAFRGNHG
jgi:signal recognition particle receptor subunit beta